MIKTFLFIAMVKIFTIAMVIAMVLGKIPIVPIELNPIIPLSNFS